MLFTKLRSLRAFEKQHMPFLRTVEDFDLVCEVGYYQEIGEPLSVKRLYLLDLGSVATVQRRLRRLRHLGAIVPRRSDKDGRLVVLTISPKLMKTCRKYGELMGIGSIPAEAASPL